MKTEVSFLCTLLMVMLTNRNQPTQKNENKTAKPNFLIIVVDDLGYSDIGPFGGNI